MAENCLEILPLVNEWRKEKITEQTMRGGIKEVVRYYFDDDDEEDEGKSQLIKEGIPDPRRR